MTWTYYYLPLWFNRLLCWQFGHRFIVHYDSSGHCRRCGAEY